MILPLSALALAIISNTTEAYVIAVLCGVVSIAPRFIYKLLGFQIIPASRIRIIDGDTFAVGNTKYRLACINAPEKNEPLGAMATEWLRIALQGKVLLKYYGKEKYGRDLVTCHLDKPFRGLVNVNLEMVRAGYARPYMVFKEAQNDYAAARNEAKKKKLGIHA